MPFFKIDDMQVCTSGRWTNLDASKKPDIKGFSTDSRDIEKDFAFIALNGERDGHDFAANAVENGASAIIAERELPEIGVPVLVVENTLQAFWSIAKMHRLRFEFPVVGITGSCGKTSTKEMLALLTAWKRPLVTQKNFNNEIGVPLTLSKLDLHKNQLAIIEAGVSGPDQMEVLADMIEPDLAIITNVGLSHLEKFSEIGKVAKEKSILAAKCASGGWCLMHHNLLSWKVFDELQQKKAVVAPSDAPDFKADLIFRYSTKETEDNISLDMSIEGGGEFFFEIPKMSAGMVENAVLAYAAALMLGGKEESIATKLRGFRPLPLRGEIVGTEKAKYYIDCYNASPTSMRDALSHFEKVSQNISPRLFVLGDMAELGLANHRHHREMASHIAHKDGDAAILIGANAAIYKEGFLAEGWEESSVQIFENSKDAKDAVSNFEGFVFVKGSRVCALEDALPDAALQTSDEEKSEEKISEEALEDCGDFDEKESPSEEAPEKEASEDDFENDEDFIEEVGGDDDFFSDDKNEDIEGDEG